MVLFVVCKMLIISLCRRHKGEFPSTVYFCLFGLAYGHIHVNNSVTHWCLGAVCSLLHRVQDDKRHLRDNGLERMVTTMHT